MMVVFKVIYYTPRIRIRKIIIGPLSLMNLVKQKVIRKNTKYLNGYYDDDTFERSILGSICKGKTIEKNRC